MDPVLKSHFLSLYCMVLADGIIDSNELQTLYKIGIEDFGINREEINLAVRDSGTSFIIPETLPDKIRFLYNMARIAWADGEIEESELNLLKKYIIRMGFMPENTDSICEYIIHGVEKGMSVDEMINEITKE